MSLKDKIAELSAQAREKIPPQVMEVMMKATEKLKKSDIEAGALKKGDKAPDFTLPDHKGGTTSLAALLASGPVVISFYHGTWCPYCNLELKALQERLPEITDLGASMIAISPQTPDNSMTIAEKQALEFDVLSDLGNRVAREFGLVFRLDESLRPIYQKFGIDLAGFNADDSFELPIPATYVIGGDGVIIDAFVDANYVARMEPDDIIAALRA